MRMVATREISWSMELSVLLVHSSLQLHLEYDVENQNSPVNCSAWLETMSTINKDRQFIPNLHNTLTEFSWFNKVYLGELVPFERMVNHNHCSIPCLSEVLWVLMKTYTCPKMDPLLTCKSNLTALPWSIFTHSQPVIYLPLCTFSSIQSKHRDE